MTRWALLALALSTVACGPPVRGAIDASGFSHSDYALKVEATKGELMPKGWKLDNYYMKETVGGEALTPKDTADYKTKYDLDFDGDDKTDDTVDEFTYDLRFTHAEHDGRLFLRTLPLSTDQGKKRLNVLLNRYLEAVAGAGYEIVKFGESAALIEKRYAVAVKAQEETSLAGQKALFARLEVANLDQIKIDPDARKEQVALLLVRTDFKYEHVADDLEKVAFPVLMIVGYANQPEDFDEGLKDYWGFLKRIKINGLGGFKVPALSEPKEETNAEEKDEPAQEAGSKESEQTPSTDDAPGPEAEGEAPVEDGESANESGEQPSAVKKAKPEASEPKAGGKSESKPKKPTQIEGGK